MATHTSTPTNQIETMENKDKSAFPLMVPDGDQKKDGLTKREYFAAMAMQGFVQHAKAETYTSVAKGAVKMADALLLELENTK